MLSQCKHSVYLLICLLITKTQTVQSIEKQPKNVCCTQKVNGNSDRSRFLGQHQATDFPSIRTRSPQVTSHNYTALDKITQGSPSVIPAGSTGQRENWMLKNKQNFSYSSSVLFLAEGWPSNLSLPLSLFPTSSSLQIQV